VPESRWSESQRQKGYGYATEKEGVFGILVKGQRSDLFDVSRSDIFLVKAFLGPSSLYKSKVPTASLSPGEGHRGTTMR
jgi:hypothetical protein